MKKSFLVQLKNRYQALVEQDDHTNNNVDEINSLWNTVEKSYQETSIGKRGIKNGYPKRPDRR